MLKLVELVIILIGLGLYFKPVYMPILVDIRDMSKEYNISLKKLLLVSGFGAIICYASTVLFLTILS